MSTNGLKKQLENWNEINWRKVNKLVKNLRQRIFRAIRLEPCEYESLTHGS
ncbi:MAG: reverse transcriptase N-terminal domain-containing protein [Scytonema sp. PMC 1070.18]|nr:reverse transcriptase N-terminal domain-containing protein [Scytonema sp. PMC 1070.18]